MTKEEFLKKLKRIRSIRRDGRQLRMLLQNYIRIRNRIILELF